jgi:integrase/recombinase XerC
LHGTLADPLIAHPARETALRWQHHLTRDRRRSAHTVRAYAATAYRLIEFMGGHLGQLVDAASLGSLGASDVRAFLASRRAEGLGNSSAARELSAVRNFLAFVAVESGGTASVPRLKGPKRPRSVPRPVSPQEAVALAEDVGEDASQPWIAARDFAVLMLLYGAGLRISEALGITGAALPLGEALSVTGKRAKTRIVPLIEPVRARSRPMRSLRLIRLPRTSPCSGAREAGRSTPNSSAAPCAPPGCGWACRTARRLMRFATASRPTCSGAAPISGRCRNCSAMPACPRRRSTLKSTWRI